MKNLDQLKTIFKHSIEHGKSVEESLIILKQKGATITESVRIIKSILNLSLQEADKVILESSAWTAHKVSSFEFRGEFADFLESLEEE